VILGFAFLGVYWLALLASRVGLDPAWGLAFTLTPAAKLSSAWSRPRGERIDRNQRIKPMQSRLPMHLSPRCGARTRSARPCQSPAMPNGRCRLHGGLSPGAPRGNRNALKDGHYTAEATARRREIASLLRSMRRLAKEAE